MWATSWGKGVQMYDVARVRGLYGSLSEGWTYLNAHARPQLPETVSAAVARGVRLAATLSSPEASSGGHHSRSQSTGVPEAESLIDSARLGVADLVGTTAEHVVLGPDLRTLYQHLVDAMRPLLKKNSSVVLSRLDDPRLVAPLQRSDAQVRWAQPDLGTGELPAWQFGELVDGSTRLVAFSAAHGTLGSIAPMAEIVEKVHARSRAWVLADVSAYLAHRRVDLEDSGFDIVAIDLAALGGPDLAALVFRSPRMMQRLAPLDEDGSEVFDIPVSAGLAAGVGPLVDHYASLGGDELRGTRRTRLRTSQEQLAEYYEQLRQHLYNSLESLAAVHILGVSGEAAGGHSDDRLPRVTFIVRDVPAATVQQRLIDNQLVSTPAKVTPLLRDMGVDEECGGATTLSLSPFNTLADIDHLTRVLASLAW